MNELTMAAIDIAKEAGAFLKKFSDERRSELKVVDKHTDLDLITEADKQSQKLIRERVLACFPDHQFIGEEDEYTNEEIGELCRQNPETIYWIVDPLDGTVNYVHNFPVYSTAIAVVKGVETISGVMYFPAFDQMYYAEKKQGAFLNGQPIHVSDCTELRHAILATGLPPDDGDRRRHHLEWQSKVGMECMSMRMLGCADMALAYVASGICDGYAERGPHPWDVSAGMLLVTEAGGEARNCDGSPYQIGTDGILVAAPGIVDKFASFGY